MTDEDPILEQAPVLAQGTGKRLAWLAGRQAFRQAQSDGQGAQGTEQGQGDKDRLPAIHIDQHTPEHRCQDRCQAHHQNQLGKHLGRGYRIALVTDDRPRQHHPGASAQCLDEARRDQRIKVGRKGASE
ncbi:hypothetical protein D3C76_996170 [compost metagenome]